MSTMQSKIRMDVDYDGKPSIQIFLSKFRSREEEDPRDQMLRSLIRKLTNQVRKSEVCFNERNQIVSGEGMEFESDCLTPQQSKEQEKYIKNREEKYNKDTCYYARLPYQFGGLGYTNCLVRELYAESNFDVYEIVPVEYQQDTFLREYSTDPLTRVDLGDELYRKSKSELLPLSTDTVTLDLSTTGLTITTKNSKDIFVDSSGSRFKNSGTKHSLEFGEERITVQRVRCDGPSANDLIEIEVQDLGKFQVPLKDFTSLVTSV
jgi:hypothetical protein